MLPDSQMVNLREGALVFLLHWVFTPAEAAPSRTPKDPLRCGDFIAIFSEPFESIVD
jgi:hypothetical protein